MPTENHMLTGLPAWATDEEAAEAAQALGAFARREEAAQPQLDRAAHAAAARFYWASAYAALEGRNFSAMRAAAERAKAAERAASPEGALIGAIFGAQAAEARAAQMGQKLPQALVEQAKKAVLAEIARHAARPRPAAKPAPARAPAPAEELPAIGSVLAVSRPHQMAKKSDGVVVVDTPEWFGYAECLGAPKGTFNARVVAHKEGRSYGYKTSIVLELI